MGFFADNFRTEVLDNDVVPWLFDKAFEHLQELVVQQSIPTNLALDHLVSEEKVHTETVRVEALRKQQVQEEAEKLAIQKLEEKR